MAILITNKPGTGSGTNVTPTVQRFLTGSGTYTTPTNPSPFYLKLTVVGGGGGGAGSGTTTAGAASAGGSSTFGTSLLTCNGGAAGGFATIGATGGSATVASPALNITSVSGGGGEASLNVSAGTAQPGGLGGSSALGGAGATNQSGGTGATAGGNGAANTGGGGGGAGGPAAGFSGGGGGAGGYLQAIIFSPSSTYSFTVGAGGTGGTPGTLGGTGGTGGSGAVIVEEYYTPFATGNFTPSTPTEFVAYNNNTATTASTTVPYVFQTVLSDTKSGYNASTGRYTIQEAGTYLFNASLTTQSGSPTVFVYKNSSSYKRLGTFSASAQLTLAIQIPGLIVGDVVELRTDTGSATTFADNNLYFAGFKIR